MRTPVRIGAKVTVASDQEPLGFVMYTFEDGSTIRATAGTNLEVLTFAELDDGFRVTTEPGVVSGGWATETELESELRDYVFEDEIRELRELDEDVAEMPLELDELIAALERAGAGVDEANLRSLPFVIELDDEVRAVLDS